MVTTGYVLGPDEGERLVHFRDGGILSIKTRGKQLAMATQQVMKGSGIAMHRHLRTDELFYVLEGNGTFTLADERYSFEPRTTIFIPRSTWHAFANPDDELLLLWIVTPAGLDDFFRATCARVGEPAKQLTPEAIRTIALEYGTEYR